MAAWGEIPELANLYSGQSLIRVPAEQNVPFTPRVRRLVDTAEFQRLTEISQLGLVSKVYPGARHTRFEHALGVYHNALRYLNQLGNDARFRELISTKQIETLIVASLLHDLGHWPFCHPIEDLGIDGLIPHEAHALRFLAPATELHEVLQSDWGLAADEVLDVLVPRTQSPELQLLRSILSGPIDVDKMDYLERDSLHCGVPYGRNFDKQRLIQSLILNAAGNGLAITAKGKTAAELMVFARYVMFSEVYWHHAVRAATSMFARCFYELHRQLDLPQLFAATDAEMIAALRQQALGTPCEPVLDGLFGFKRRLYKQVCEFSHDQFPEVYQVVAGQRYPAVVDIGERLVDYVRTAHGVQLRPLELLIDAPPPHREVEFAIDVYFEKQQQFRPLRSVSPVIEALATQQFDDWVKRVRIFAAPERVAELSAVDWQQGLLTAPSQC